MHGGSQLQALIPKAISLIWNRKWVANLCIFFKKYSFLFTVVFRFNLERNEKSVHVAKRTTARYGTQLSSKSRNWIRRLICFGCNCISLFADMTPRRWFIFFHLLETSRHQFLENVLSSDEVIKNSLFCLSLSGILVYFRKGTCSPINRLLR